MDGSQLPTEWKEVQNFSRQKNQQIKADKKQMQKLFLGLLTIGLILGVVVSAGIIKILSWSGLTEKPQPTLQK
jgi:hypothetical protein